MTNRKTWIIMLYQANQPNNVVRVSEHPTKRQAVTALKHMVSNMWSASVVENTYAYNGVYATVVEAEIVETVQ